mgnify:CR=1 FL=1
MTNQFYALVKKDILIEWRDKGLLLLIAVLTFLFFFIFSLALDDSIGGEIGILWVVYLVLIALMTQKHLTRETENRSWDGLFLAPIDPGIVFISKCSFYVLFLLLSDVILIPLYLIFFNTVPVHPFFFLLTVFIGKIGIVSVSVLMAILTMSHRMKEFLTILLQIPLLIPLLIAEIELMKYSFWGEPTSIPFLWLALVSGFSILFTALPTLLLSIIKEV